MATFSKSVEIEKKGCQSLQASWFTNSNEFPEQKTKIVSGRRDQISHCDIDETFEPRPPHTTRLAHLRKRSFATSTWQPLKLLAFVSWNALPV